MTIREAVAEPLIRRRSARRRRAACSGVGLLARTGERDHAAARPGVGYGVMESRVESGRIDRHPIKRARTTFTYLAVAAHGTDEQKAAYRRAVNGAHAQVYSTAESPVAYNAFDPDLQMWVARLHVQGRRRHLPMFVGEMDDETAEQLFAEGIALGHHVAGATRDVAGRTRRRSTLLARSRWPRSTSTTTVREYLWPIAAGRVRGVQAARAVQRMARRLNLLITGGLSAAAVPRRDGAAVGRRQTAPVRPVDDCIRHRQRSVADRVIRQFPFNWMLKDLDWRIRTGRPLV